MNRPDDATGPSATVTAGAVERLPLFSAAGPEAIVAWRHDGPVTARTLLADIETMAARLPPRGPMLNLCGDRYRFAVAFCAAALRGHTSLLPPNRSATMIGHLQRTWPALYAVADGGSADDGGGSESVAVPTVSFEAAGGGAGAGRDAPQGGFVVPTIAVDQVTACVFTSGSTGLPTAHVKHWGRLVVNVRAEARRLGIGPEAPATLVGTVPAQHMYGFESTVLLALHNGIAFHAARPFFAADIVAALAAIDGERVLVTTPFHLRNLLDSGVEVPPLRLVVSATAPLPARLAATAEERLQAPLLEIYGCTEAGQLATRRTVEGETWRTFDGVRIDAGPGGWFASGGHIAEPTRLADLLALDDPEHFRLLGRDNDLVNIAGKRTSIAHLDQLLLSIPGVQDGAFVDPGAGGAGDVADDADRPRRLTAFFVSDTLDARAVLAALRTMTDAVFLPRPLHRVDSLPRAATGKLPRAALLALATAQRPT